MSRQAIFLVVSQALAALVLSACASQPGITMNEDDARVWMGARAQNGVGVLDGHKFKVEFGEFGGSKSEDDWLEFAGGRFRSSMSDERQFGSGPYATKSVEGGVEFHATCKSSTGGTIWWHGTVKGNDVEGGSVTTIPGEPTLEHEFHGTDVSAGVVK